MIRSEISSWAMNFLLSPQNPKIPTLQLIKKSKRYLRGNKPVYYSRKDRVARTYAKIKIDVRSVYRPPAGAAAKEIHINMYIFSHDRIAGVSVINDVSRR